MESKIEYEINDAKLVLCIREGNEDAKDYLYKKFSPLIHKEINRVKKKAYIYDIDFSDLTQEAMLGFTYAINNFDEDGESKFITFATTCVRRRLKRYVEKFETTKNKSLSASLSLDTDLDDTNSTKIDQVEELISTEPLRKLINDETLDEVSQRIGKSLNDKEKLALQYSVDGKSVSEIADLMDMNTKQIYNLIHRARNKIRVKP